MSKHDFYDVKKTGEKNGLGPVPISHPRLTLDDEQLPPIKDWEVGSKKTLVVKAVLDDKHLDSEEEEFSATFKIKKIADKDG